MFPAKQQPLLPVVDKENIARLEALLTKSNYIPILNHSLTRLKIQKYSGLFSLSDTVVKVINRREEMFGPTYICLISWANKMQSCVWRWTSSFETMSAKEKVDMVCLFKLGLSPGHYKK